MFSRLLGFFPQKRHFLPQCLIQRFIVQTVGEIQMQRCFEEKFGPKSLSAPVKKNNKNNKKTPKNNCLLTSFGLGHSKGAKTSGPCMCLKKQTEFPLLEIPIFLPIFPNCRGEADKQRERKLQADSHDDTGI